MYKNRERTRPRNLPYNLRRSFVNIFNRISENSDQSESEQVNSIANRESSNNSNSSNDSISSIIMSKTQNGNDIVNQNANPNLNQNLNPNANQNLNQNANQNQVVNQSEQIAAAAATQIFNSLRIPDAVKDLPKFDGNPRLLFDFIDNVEGILKLVTMIDGTLYGQILLRSIRNKIEGQANEVLNMYGTPLNWNSIKDNLILHYADKRNETSLIKDLHSLKQYNKPIEKFYSEIIEIQATIFNHLQIHETDSSVINAKRDLYCEMCLNTFLTGLKEPLGSTIRAMQPRTLQIAFAYCMEEQNIGYFKSETHNQNKQKFPQHFNHQRFNQQPVNFPSLQQRSFVSPQYQNTFKQFQPQQPFFRQQNSPFNMQQRQPTSFNQQQRPFAPNPSYRPNLPKPVPMDTSSGNTHLRQQTRYQPPNQNSNNFQQYNRQPRFTSKELFNVNEQNSQLNQEYGNIYSNDNYQSNLDKWLDDYQNNSFNLREIGSTDNDRIHDQNYRSDDSNFHPTASTSQPNT